MIIRPSSGRARASLVPSFLQYTLAPLCRAAFGGILLGAALIAPAQGADATGRKAAAPEPRALRAEIERMKSLPVPPHLTSADLSRRPRLRDVRLSPDGRRLAWLDVDGQKASVMVMDLATRERRVLLRNLGRAELHWGSGGEVLFLNEGGAISAVSLHDGHGARIATLDRKLRQEFAFVDPTRPAHVVVTEFDRSKPLFRMHRVDAAGARELLYESAREARDFLLDAEGQLAFVRELGPDYVQLVMRRTADGWREATRCKRLRACGLVSVTPDGRTLTMIVNHDDDRRALVEVDVATGRQRLLASDSRGIADLRTVVLTPRTQRVRFAVYDMPARRNEGLDDEARSIAGDIARRFPEGGVTVELAEDGPRALLTERGPRLMHDRYWLYDRRKRDVEELLADERVAGNPVAEQHLAPKIPVRYRASDGFLVHGYLTLPPGRDPATVPLVTHVHGGPWGKIENDYQDRVQLLVNRGYAVFQPNFRASTGYGDRYMLAGKGDFGNGRVHKDILDGIHWLLEQGVGDRSKLAIMGDSFGGYSTFLALTHTPDMFRFGIAGVPPPDFVRSLRDTAAGGNDAGTGVPYARRFADLDLDLDNAAALARIEADAPIRHPHKVTSPLLVLAGGKDDKVSIASVTEYVAKLQTLGKPVTLLVDPDEGHHPGKPIIRQAYVYLLEKMLHVHFGGPEVPAPSPELAQYLEKTIRADGALGLALQPARQAAR